jgi:hypothetical protein
MKASTLKTLINNAVETFGLHNSWLAPKTNSCEILLQHLDSLCNENGVKLENGKVVKQ